MKGNPMRKVLKSALTGTLATLVFGIVCVSRANAQCANPEWRNASALPSPSGPASVPTRPDALARAAEEEGEVDGIVGFWKVKFVSEGNPGIPDGAVIDNGFAQWHGDGTEIMNSSRPPATGNFCLGVWRQSGPSRFELNHFALSSDPGGNFVGPAQIREHVTLDRKARQYEGTFTIDQYDPAGNLLAHIAGRVVATRVTVDTSVGDIL